MQRDMGEASLRFAQILIERWVPSFTGTVEWDAHGLVVQSAHHGRGVVLPTRQQRRQDDELSDTTPGRVGALGAMAAFTAATVMHGHSGEALVVTDANDLVVAGSPPPAGESLGFLRLRSGWVGVAVVGDDQHRLVRALIEDGLGERSPGGAARVLQSFGLPSMPARSGVSPRSPVPAGEHRDARVAATSALPQVLHGVHVADFGRLVAAPFAADLLKGLGAEITRVRPLRCGGRWGAGEEIDLRSRHGRVRARKIAAAADVLIENCSYRAGSRLRDSLGAGLPRHVVAVRGFRSSSPCANWRVLGFLVEAALRVGSSPVVGTDRSWIAASSTPLWDRVAGTVAAAAVVSGLLGSRRTKTSRVVTVPLVDLALLLAHSRREPSRAA
jgi:hypothetical protein